jgi:uncharacterized lipoprotein YmbA
MSPYSPGNWWWPCVLALLAAACASTPLPRYYVLEALRTADAPATRVSILVEPVAVPAEVDRPQIVRATKANEVAIEDLHRWASPLQDNIAEVLAGDLSAQLGARDVSTSQDAGAYRYRVNVAIREFGSRLGEYARLGANWSVRRDDGSTRRGYSSVRETARGSDFAALASAHSRAISRMSQEISDAIRALEQDPAKPAVAP